MSVRHEYSSLVAQLLTPPATLVLMYMYHYVATVRDFALTWDATYAWLWHLPALEPTFFLMYLTGLGVSLTLYLWMPGRIASGPVGPSGGTTQYKLNSLACLTAILVGWTIMTRYARWFSSSFLVDHLGEMLHCFVGTSLVMSALAYLKGRYLPSNHDNHVRSGQCAILRDVISGIELAPKLGATAIDLKLFVVGHIGMPMWALMNLNYFFYALDQGVMPWEVLVVNVLQLIYIYDWAYFEQWYLSTVDMKYDRFGLLIIFGSMVWVPMIYAAYAWYLSTHPHEDCLWRLGLCTCAYLVAYILFRLANSEKSHARRTGTTILGQPAVMIRAPYTTVDGEKHTAALLCNGFWGLSRHFNYLTDMVMCVCLSCICGFEHLFPHIYTCFIICLLINRARRDDEACHLKYGAAWLEYCEAVPSRIVPFLY